MPRPGQRVVNTWRSGSEEKLAGVLEGLGVPFGFETRKITYTTPATKHQYTPDFNLENGVILEVKGRWVAGDRKKMVLIRKQHPDLDIRMVFDRPATPINKGSKTTYAIFCDRNGIKWCRGVTPPADWLAPTIH